MNVTLADIVGRLKAAGRIGADDVLSMRAQIYGAADKIEKDDLEALADLDTAAPDRPPEWGAFFAEAMTDYVVRQQVPEDYVDDGKADWTIALLSRGSGPTLDGGLEALARILDAATQAPDRLAAYGLDAAKARVIAKGRVEAEDVALLRRMVFAGAGESNIGVSREEADALFDVNDACKAAANDPAWADFFARCVGDYLTAVSPFHLAGRDEARHEEEWLEGKDSLGHFMSGMVKAPDVKGAFREVFHPFQDEEDEWKAAADLMETQEAAAAPVTDDEARWLVGRLSHGALSEAETRLLTFLKGQAAQISPLLHPLLDAAPDPAPEPAAAPGWDADEDLFEPAPVFGQRKVAGG